MNLELSGKRAIVTGGSRGIGKEIARALAGEGVEVVICARGSAEVNQTASELASETGSRVEPFACDVRDGAGVTALVDHTFKMLNGIDILVNNAGLPGGRKAATIDAIDVQALLEDIDLKLGGAIRAIQATLPYMISGGWGRIINIGGLGARVTGNYAGGARTAIVSTLTKNLGDEVGRNGVTANAIHPGFIRQDEPSPAYLKTIEDRVSIGRAIAAVEIAYLVTMLASPKSAAINGQTIQAGGGLLGGIDY